MGQAHPIAGDAFGRDALAARTLDGVIKAEKDRTGQDIGTKDHDRCGSCGIHGTGCF